MCPSSTTSSEVPGDPSGKTGAIDAGASDGLVALPEVPQQGRDQRRVRWIVSLFVVLTAGTGLIDLLWPIEKPRLLGWERRQRQVLEETARWADGSKARWVENEIKTRSRVRQWVLPPYALGLYQGLREVRGDLVVGREGWLFLRSRVTPRAEEDPAIVQHSLDLMSAIQARIAARGSRLVWIPIPRKGLFEEDRLPPGIEPRARLDHLLIDQAHRRGLDVVDLLPLLTQRATTGEAPYFRADSHWTLDTVVASAEEIARQLDLWKPPEERRTLLDDQLTTPPRFDLLRYLGVRPSTETLRWLTPERATAYRVLLPEGEPLRRLQPWKSKTELALVGTSFSDLSGLVSFVEHYTQVRTLDASKAGNHPFHQLRNFVKRRDELGLPLPPTILFEVPNHLFFEEASLDKISPESTIPDPPPAP